MFIFLLLIFSIGFKLGEIDPKLGWVLKCHGQMAKLSTTNISGRQ